LAAGWALIRGSSGKRFTPNVEAIEIEPERAAIARKDTPHALVAVAEHLPYPANRFDLVFSNEVIETRAR